MESTGGLTQGPKIITPHAISSHSCLDSWDDCWLISSRAAARGAVGRSSLYPSGLESLAQCFRIPKLKVTASITMLASLRFNVWPRLAVKANGFLTKFITHSSEFCMY
jgi:hypothetical protein